jgi:hypothetical protein
MSQVWHLKIQNSISTFRMRQWHKHVEKDIKEKKKKIIALQS